MAITLLSTKAPEEGTYILTVTFEDENDVAVTPNTGTIKWTLSDLLGNVVNNRTQVVVSSASSITIVLTGDDLALSDTLFGVRRELLVEADYNSSAGNNLKIKQACQFDIENLVKVS